MKPSWTSLGALPSSGEAPKRDPFWGVCPRSPPNIPLHGSSEKLPRLHTIRAESKPALLQEAPTCSQECSGRPPQARNRYPTGELLGRCKCVCCAWLAASCLLGVGAVRRRAQGSPRTLWPTSEMGQLAPSGLPTPTPPSFSSPLPRPPLPVPSRRAPIRLQGRPRRSQREVTRAPSLEHTLGLS